MRTNDAGVWARLDDALEEKLDAGEIYFDEMRDRFGELRTRQAALQQATAVASRPGGQRMLVRLAAATREYLRAFAACLELGGLDDDAQGMRALAESRLGSPKVLAKVSRELLEMAAPE